MEVDFFYFCPLNNVLCAVTNLSQTLSTPGFDRLSISKCKKRNFSLFILVANNQNITIRSCQTAKTENIDPCKTMEGMLAGNNYKLEFCELCTEDACNSSIAISPKIFLTLLFVLGALVLGCSYNNA